MNKMVVQLTIEWDEDDCSCCSAANTWSADTWTDVIVRGDDEFECSGAVVTKVEDRTLFASPA